MYKQISNKIIYSTTRTTIIRFKFIHKVSSTYTMRSITEHVASDKKIHLLRKTQRTWENIIVIHNGTNIIITRSKYGYTLS